MLANLQLRNIKCFDDLDVSLSGLNILTGINGAGKSTVIQSVLMAEQSANSDFLELNGPLVEIGDYSDLLHEVAEDDSAHIAIDSNDRFYCWGYSNALLEDKSSISNLPRLGGDLDLPDFPGFSNFLYISAERWGPRNNVPLNVNSQNKYWLGKHGEYTIPVLSTLSARLLSGKGQDEKEDLLSEKDPRNYEGQDSRLIFDNIVSWMGEISPNVTIDPKVIEDARVAYSSFSFKGSNQYRASNVGFGLSYALSVVTALLISKPGSLVIIENPEAHLHPKGQSKLGQLTGLAAKAGVQVIIETHSEHVINGARILVRKNILPASEVNILYFKRDDKKKKSICEKLTVNEVGQISQWPEGFFDQQAIDMKILMSGE
jgi:predicted ATPase